MANPKMMFEDLLVEILSRLPAKSLLRFRCVCKHWCNLIGAQYFVSKHLYYFTNDCKNACLLIKHEPHGYPWLPWNTKLTRLSLFPDREFSDHDMRIDDFNVPEFKGRGHMYLKPCCINGIICLWNYYVDDSVSFNISSKFCMDILLWNPSIREYKLLPRQAIDYSHHPRVCYNFEVCSNNKSSYRFNALGFGYDAKSDDYKVIRVVNFFVEKLRCADRPPLIEHYSLKANSWKKLDIQLTANIPHKACTEIYLNGVYHWLAIDTDLPRGRDDFILSFDMVDEAFGKIHLPAMGAPDASMSKSIAMLNNCIAMIIHYLEDVTRCFDIWVMKEYGMKESWNKRQTIGPFNDIEAPLGFWRTGGLLLYKRSGELVLLDDENQRIKDLQVRGVSFTSGALIYVDNLVSIRG